MRLIYCFDREKPFAQLVATTPNDVIERYERRLAAALEAHFPEHEVVVRQVVNETSDVIFEPADVLTDVERLELALEVKRIAHRLADEMFAERFGDSDDE